MRPKYSPKEREAAVALYANEGLAGAHKATGITKTSIKRWAERAGVVTSHNEKTQAATEARRIRIDALRSELKEVLLTKARDLAARMDAPHIDFKSAGPLGPVQVIFPIAPAAACQNYATSIGILIDKFRLESGEVTSRDEHHNVQQSELDRDISTLLAEMAHREKAGAEGETALSGTRLEPDSAPEAADAGRQLDDLVDTSRPGMG